MYRYDGRYLLSKVGLVTKNFGQLWPKKSAPARQQLVLLRVFSYLEMVLWMTNRTSGLSIPIPKATVATTAFIKHNLKYCLA